MSQPQPTEAQAQWMEDYGCVVKVDGRRYHNLGFSLSGGRYVEDWLTGERIWLKDSAEVELSLPHSDLYGRLPARDLDEETRRIASLFPNRPTPIDGTAAP